jgi:hypothetical protein
LLDLVEVLLVLVLGQEAAVGQPITDEVGQPRKVGNRRPGHRHARSRAQGRAENDCAHARETTPARLSVVERCVGGCRGDTTEVEAHDRDLLPRRAVVLRDDEPERELLPLFDFELPLRDPEPLLLRERELFPLRERDEPLPPLRELVPLLRLRERDEAWLRPVREPLLDDLRCSGEASPLPSPDGASLLPLPDGASLLPVPDGASSLLPPDSDGKPESSPPLASFLTPLPASGASAASPTPAAMPLTPDRGPRGLLRAFEATVLTTSRAA